MPELNPAPRPITIAIMAMGGQGGGVLADWVVSLAEANGHLVQATSVPGVAQRTGATIYYLELFPEAEAQRSGQAPVLALMPSPGDVDIVLAAEFMEAGRALERGLVTPDRTTVIASSHRVYGITEKSAMGNGILDPEPVRQALHDKARQVIEFDMDAMAHQQGSVISAVLFGALAGSETLPFAREAFEEAIRKGGIGVEASLRAFAAGTEHASTTPSPDPRDDAQGKTESGLDLSHPTELHALEQRIDELLPADAADFARDGVRRLIDYQDTAYASEYLDLLSPLARKEQTVAAERHGIPISQELARHLALWMSYEDTIRVADLKIRRDRQERVREEVKAKPDQIVYTAEFMHPRVEEVCDTLPAPLGRWIMNTGWVRKPLAKLTQRGRRISPQRLRGFLLLFSVASLRRWRRGTLRYVEERRRIEAWLATVERALDIDANVALEVIKAQGLVKGYGDTHRRGLASFDTVMQGFERFGDQPDAAAKLKDLRDASQADEEGTALKRSVGEWMPQADSGAEKHRNRIDIQQLN
ncbi:indolepyruvate oxidoreductase subunit beta family protein [Halomonas urumqiensis]|uniref:Indolepyruvate oxidoreductase subunit B n=1 Tax=Halomonas urumqiensis TaxID=1684789 RepID=A0A2N7UCD9_9GAMM|nr:indolepyruvate oxidoreductase subunit beta family protein [Halomonas urumqiensis]PMR78094.1 indolepyruvate oxidoreductase subunit B [Halomonas urumqiensis]PTB03245.1 hypothetical protein C6V82_01685 [Halomonas urumqiensis]GHE20600.1 indolepyruvate oxidoreductase [Halomonas urumqiensis]